MMMKQIEDFLPVGSVIMLKDATKRMMIFGIIQSIQEEQQEFDYIGVPYPEGNMGQEYQYLFNHEDIETVYFRGYEDEERTRFIANLAEFCREQMN